MKILLLSAYHAQSHKVWCDGLMQNFPEYQWQLMSLPARYFNWHMRGNALIWRTFEKEIIEKKFDLIIATSMVDLHGLRGFLPGLADIPSLLYFHENQFSYPQNSSQSQQVELQLVSVYSALSADIVVFNSKFNAQTFREGLEKLLRKLPDFTPKEIIEEISKKTHILPVPLCESEYHACQKKDDQFSIVWNHRWEYDKWPENFFLTLLKLKQENVEFKVHVLGQQFRQQPPIFAKIKHDLDGVIQTWGRIEDDQKYRQTLSNSKIVVSTALHDFQGLAVQEAVMCGCVPVVPNRLAYPEFFQEVYLYESCPDNNERQANILAMRLTQLANELANDQLISAPSLQVLSWSEMKKKYAEIFKLSIRCHRESGKVSLSDKSDR